MHQRRKATLRELEAKAPSCCFLPFGPLFLDSSSLTPCGLITSGEKSECIRRQPEIHGHMDNSSQLTSTDRKRAINYKCLLLVSESNGENCGRSAFLCSRKKD